MTRIYAIANQKGGVGKTTTAINLAAALALVSQRALLVDLDPQGNATTGSGINKRNLRHSAADVLLHTANIDACIVRSPSGSYDLIPSNDSLSIVESRLLDRPGHEYRLRDSLRPVADHYHYILIDCPPALSILTINGLTAAQRALVPIQCEYYALEGVASLRNTITQVRETTNSELDIGGILRTMYDSRNNLAQDVSTELVAHFGNIVLDTIIPRNVALAEAPSHGEPIVTYDVRSSGALAYISLAGEIQRRNMGENRFSTAG